MTGTFIDIDFENMKINVTHQLQRKCDMEYINEDTKTAYRTRQVPMTEAVFEASKKVRKDFNIQ